MERLKFGLIFIVFFLAIPIVGILVSGLVSNGYEKKYESIIIQMVKEKKGIDVSNNKLFLSNINLNNVCQEHNIDNGLTEVCNNYTNIKYLGYVSNITLFFAIAILLIIAIFGKISIINRGILFFVFRPGLFLAQISAAILMLANSGILICSIYYAESFYLERVHAILLLMVGIATIIGALGVCLKALTPIRKAEICVLGKVLSKVDYPAIWNFVESIAKQMETTVPNTIIVGMDPNFFVTEMNAICLDGKIQGKTLYLSLPFCNVITQAELTAILGHEMGHFIGKDTKWSQKFYPIYKGAIETANILHQTNSDHGLVQLSFLPSILFINFFINSFSKAEKKISRERELNADTMGGRISSAINMATALLKVHVYQHVWIFTQNKMREALSQGKHIINLSAFFTKTCSSLPSNIMEHEIGNSNTSHPTDSHPPLSLRLDALGIPLSTLYINGIQLPNNSETAIELINDSGTLEEELSIIEYQKLIQSGTVKINIDAQNPN